MPKNSESTSKGFTRRSVLKTAGAAVAFSPFFPLNAFAKAMSGLTLMSGTPNPSGAFQQLYWLGGHARYSAPAFIETTKGNALPSPALANGEKRVLRIFHFNDLHNYITLPHSLRAKPLQFWMDVGAFAVNTLVGLPSGSYWIRCFKWPLASNIK